MRGRIVVFTALILLICSGCKKEGELKGSVFIVTKGAENYKLGLVLVSAIPEDRMRQFVESKKAYIKTQLDKHKTNQDSYKNNLTTAQKNYDEAKKAFDTLSTEKSALTSKEQELSSSINATNLSENDVEGESGDSEPKAEQIRQRKTQQLQALRQQIAKYEPLIEDARNKLSIAEKQLSDIKSQVLINQQKIIELFNEEALYEGVPEGSIKAVTDADGKFVLRLPNRGKFAIAARSERRVYDSTEKYYWLIWTSLDGQDSKQIMLTNQNMLGQDTDDAVFNFKELIPKTAELNGTSISLLSSPSSLDSQFH